MKKILLTSSILALVAALAGCETTGTGIAIGSKRPLFVPPPPVVIDPAVGDPCIEAALAKYFIGPERVTLTGSSPQGAATAVTLKADVRDAVCLVSAKGAVISLTDTTPKSANQIAAEEAAALAKANGTAEPVAEPKPKAKKKKPVKKPV